MGNGSEFFFSFAGVRGGGSGVGEKEGGKEHPTNNNLSIHKIKLPKFDNSLHFGTKHRLLSMQTK